MGTAFGSGASQTVFGSKGSGGFLMKVTFAVAALFFATSITLTYISNKTTKQTSSSQKLLGKAAEMSQPKNKTPAVKKNTLPAKTKKN